MYSPAQTLQSSTSVPGDLFLLEQLEPRAAAEPTDRRCPLTPLFRWPGGKRWLVRELLKLLPNEAGRYFEPFFGAGALYFAHRPTSALVSDSNSELMDCYRAIRDAHEDVASILGALPRDAKSYYEIRAQNPTTPVARAARFIYLTTLAFNGIYRVNRDGKFNVPYGGRTYGALGTPEQLRPYREALLAAEIMSGDFEVALDGAKCGDVIYLDPPYTVAHSNNGFLKYNDRIFSWNDQQRLASVARELDRRGCVVIVSNAHHESIAALYAGFRAHLVSRTSVMAADKSKRKAIQEYVFTSGGLA